MGVALAVGLLFLAGALYNLLGPVRDTPETLAGLAIAGVLIGLSFFVKSERRKDDALLAWLSENSSVISAGGARYGDVLITPDTRLTQYVVALSFLVVSFRVPSRLYIVGHDASPLVATAFTAISLLLGWWGVPWGPVYTLRAVWTNVRGGAARTVADIVRPAQA